jgi:hypothetical protein
MGIMIQTIGQLTHSTYLEQARNGDAQSLLPTLIHQDSSTDKTRYKFEKGTPREQALNALFEQAFQTNSLAVIQAAEQEAPSKAIFYPQWKSVCRIEIPKVIGNTINHPLVKIALTIAALYYTYVTCQAAYHMTTQLVGRSLPFIINNTPIQIIRLGNMALDLKDYVRKNVFRILFYTWVARTVVLHAPEMPVITPLARRIDLWTLRTLLVPKPATIVGFLWQNSFSAATFTWNACTEAGEFINGRVEQAEKERLAICKAKAFKVWVTVNQ